MRKETNRSTLGVATYRMTLGAKKHLKSFSTRSGVSQGELLRRFIETLPKTRDKLPKQVTVNISP